MSIQGAFLSSLTSLNARQAEMNLISANVANANTAGYSSESLDPSAIVYGGQVGGVALGAVQRATNAALAGAANQAAGAQAYSASMSAALASYGKALSATATDSSSDVGATDGNVLSSSLTALQSALTALSDSPGDAATQDAAVGAARDAAGAINDMIGAVKTGREQADQDIDTDVRATNAALASFSDNETAIKKAQSLGQPTASLEDKRDQLVSTIAQYIPVKTLSKSDGGIALVTDGGTTLYDGVARQLSFTPTRNIPDTLGVSADPAQGITAGLSQVTVDGAPISSSQGGSIAAGLQLRDTTLPQFAQQLNELAGNVITAFQSADPSVSSGQAGLFTANGGAIDAATPRAGLAAGIAVNAAVDPQQGGSAWRIQYGAQATAQGQKSDTTATQAYLGAMEAVGGYGAGTGIPASGMLTAAGAIAGAQQGTYATWSGLNTTRQADFSSAQTAASNATGVNVDDQMQRLLLIQQTFAASSQIIQAASSMLQNLNSMVASAIG